MALPLKSPVVNLVRIIVVIVADVQVQILRSKATPTLQKKGKRLETKIKQYSSKLHSNISLIISINFIEHLFRKSNVNTGTSKKESDQTPAANSPRSSNSSSTTNTSQATNSEGEDFVYVEKVIEKK